MNAPTIELFDTTLRDGTQGEHVTLSVNDKLRIAHRLDAFGIDVIEGGWPGSNPKYRRGLGQHSGGELAGAGRRHPIPPLPQRWPTASDTTSSTTPDLLRRLQLSLSPLRELDRRRRV